MTSCIYELNYILFKPEKRRMSCGWTEEQIHRVGKLLAIPIRETTDAVILMRNLLSLEMSPHEVSKADEEVHLLRRLATITKTEGIDGKHKVFCELLCQLWSVSSDTDNVVYVVNDIVGILVHRSTEDENHENEVDLIKKLLVLLWGETDVNNSDNFQKRWEFLDFLWEERSPRPKQSERPMSTNIDSGNQG